MFARTVQVVHLEKSKSGDMLPQYEEVAHSENDINEKEAISV